MTARIIVIGGGGHAGVLIDALWLSSAEILGIVDPALAGHDQRVHGLPVLGGDEVVERHPRESVLLVNAVGSTRSTDARARIFTQFKSLGYRFAPVLHPGAIMARDVIHGEGIQVMAGAVVQTGTRFGDNCLVNTRASVDHDCRIGAHVHLAPGAILSGNVTVGDSVHIGTGAVVIQSLSIGSGALIGAGTVVTRDVEAAKKAVGAGA